MALKFRSFPFRNFKLLLVCILIIEHSVGEFSVIEWATLLVLPSCSDIHHSWLNTISATVSKSDSLQNVFVVSRNLILHLFLKQCWMVMQESIMLERDNFISFDTSPYLFNESIILVLFSFLALLILTFSSGGSSLRYKIKCGGNHRGISEPFLFSCDLFDFVNSFLF